MNAKFGNMWRLVLLLILSFCLVTSERGRAGEEAAPVDESAEAVPEDVSEEVDPSMKAEVDAAPGLRMDPILIEVASIFLGGTEVSEVIPQGAMSSAQDGYVVQQYAALDANAGEIGTFYRIRTLVGEVKRDVAVNFDKDGKLTNAYDLLVPAVDEEATKKATAEAKRAKAAEANEEAGAPVAGAVVKFKSVPSAVMVEMMVGLDVTTEATGIVALMKGLICARNLLNDGGLAQKKVKVPADALKVAGVLPKAGTPAPEFSYKALTGETVAKATFRRRPFVVFVTSMETMQGLTSAEPLQRRGAVMMSRISRWLTANSAKLKKSALVVLADKAEDMAKLKQEEKPQILMANDADALKTFGISVSPMLLFYDASGNLTQAFSAASTAEDYQKVLDGLLK